MRDSASRFGILGLGNYNKNNKLYFRKGYYFGRLTTGKLLFIGFKGDLHIFLVITIEQPCFLI